MNYRELLKDKKRVVIKVGSSSLIHKETNKLDLRKLEVLPETFFRVQPDGGTDSDDEEYDGQQSEPQKCKKYI